MKTRCFLFACLFSTAWAFAKESPLAKKADPRDKLDCTAKELAIQDCHLKASNYDIRILPKTVAWHDGTWHTVDPMPLGGEAIEWERIGFRFLGKRPILQLWLWDKGAGETQVQSLHWYTTDAEKRKLTLLSEGVVRKRRREAVAEVAPDPNAVKKFEKATNPPPPKYIYDGWEPHYVRALPNGDLEWQLAGQKKIIPKLELTKNKK